MPWGFFFYTDVRGSLLFGRSHQDATQQFTGGVPASQSFSASGSQDAFLPITEMELGVGWTRKVGKRLSLIAKAGFCRPGLVECRLGLACRRGSFRDHPKFFHGNQRPVPDYNRICLQSQLYRWDSNPGHSVLRICWVQTRY